MRKSPSPVAGRRVLQIAAFYPPHLGGVERVVEALAETLATRRDVEVITTALGVQSSDVLASGVQSSGRSSLRVRRYRAVEVAHTPISPGIFGALLRAERGAVWHVHCAQALIAEQVMVAARLRRQQYLLHFHLDVPVSGPLGRLLPVYKRHVFGRALRAAAGVIVLTDEQAAFVAETYRVPRQRVHVVPNGVADRYFLAPRPASDGPLRLLYVGRLEVQKNVERLIEAVALAEQKVQLRIVGDGALRAQLEQLAVARGLPIEFSGALFGDDLLRAYGEADAFVLPSDREGMALVALEAMAAGLPVIATDVPGNRELIADRGLLAAPRPDALAAAVDRLAADPGLRSEVAQRCAQAARGYSWDAVAELVERVYDEVCA